MKCLRCGYCCKNYLVTIVDNPELGIKKGNLIVNSGNGISCKHLEERNGEFFCKIHDYDWYKETPCYEFSQIEREDSPCRLGTEIIKRKKK